MFAILLGLIMFAALFSLLLERGLTKYITGLSGLTGAIVDITGC